MQNLAQRSQNLQVSLKAECNGNFHYLNNCISFEFFSPSFAKTLKNLIQISMPVSLNQKDFYSVEALICSVILQSLWKA